MSDPVHSPRIDFSAFDAALRRKAAEWEAGSRSPSVPTVMASRSRLTEVEMTWIEKRYEQWLRFGRVASERIVSRRTRVAAFRPNAVFAFVRWSANDYGTVFSRIDIVRAVTSGEPYTTLPFVKPGGELLLSIMGWPKVEQVLRAIDAVEAAGIDPCDACPDHWRHIASRLAVGAQPRAYTAARHEAWLRRKALGQ